MKTFFTLSFIVCLNFSLNAQLKVLSTGDVGVGTATPENTQGWNRVLDVHGSNHSKTIVTTDVGGVETGMWSHSSGFFGAPIGGMVGTASAHPFSLVAGGVVQATMTPGGKVGIGATNPQWNLEVGGTGAGTGIIMATGGEAFVGWYDRSLRNINNLWGWFANNGSTYLFDRSNLQLRLTVTNTGNVGINNTNPQYTLDVNGIIRGNNVVPSDERLKENIQNVTASLNSLKKLHGVTYRLRRDGISTLTASSKTKSAIPDTDGFHANPPVADSLLYSRNHIGLLAQEVRKIFPDLVYEDKNGILSVDYISLIPVLIESVKELNSNRTADSTNVQKELQTTKKQLLALNSELSKLKARLNQCCPNSTLKNAQADASIDNTLNEQNVNALNQNAPNPFSQKTEISYYVIQSAQKATINVYDLQGVQKKSYPITTRGNGSLTINGYEFRAGMYLYSLIVDGREIDTKKMILTE
jgi:hypothetical protein